MRPERETGSDRPRLLVLDDDALRIARIRDALESTAVDFVSCAYSATLVPERVAAVLVALPNFGPSTDPIPRKEVREALHLAMQVGARTLGYGPSLDAPSLEQRCRLLLEGIEVLLDADSSDFLRRLCVLIGSAVDRHRTRRHEELQIETVLAEQGVVAKSSVMRSVLRRLVRLADVAAPVLVTGETGTGKELAARVLHASDQIRARGPFIPLNCAALSKTLSESALFGHRRGSFSGALQDRIGLVRAAEGGVLFLDEVGDLDWELQGKLLRVIQESRVLPVGDEREHPVDVRIVAATHRDLAALVAGGGFREDLFYRLSVVSVHLPPLRDRRDDIPALVHHFVRAHTHRPGRPPPSVADEVVAVLQQMALPGNVRQLENIVRSGLAHMEPEGELGLLDLPVGALEEVVATHAPPHAQAQGQDWNLGQVLDRCERSLLESALLETKGSQVGAAKLLGVTTRTMFNKLRKHRIEPKSLRRSVGEERGTDVPIYKLRHR